MAGTTQHLFSHKTFYTFLALVLLAGISYAAYSYTTPVPNPGHGGDTVLIAINGAEKTLQEAIDDGDFASMNGTSPSSGTGGGSLLLCTTPSVPGMCDQWPAPGQGMEDFSYSYPIGSQCCQYTSANDVQLHDVSIGIDNNGASSPDCWFASSSALLNQPCGQPQWSFLNHDVKQCVDALVSWYNTLNIGGKTGGWVLYGGKDTGNASPCVDGSSDEYILKLARKI